ncbi:MAG: inner membrane protein [bacterium ADurb.Bin363]|nr:MAG: inner membrane protein [bacterium ADurb.Bin363]
MDPITHGIIGAAVARLTGNNITISDAATVSIVVGSIFPDIDIVFQKWGDYVYLKNHRGLTHSIMGIIISSIFLAISLGFFFRGTAIYELFMWSFAGGLSHSAFDLLNSYGAKLLWPFCNKKFSLGILNTFDPLLLLTLTSYIVSRPDFRTASLIVFISYIVLRILMKWFVSNEIHKNYTTEGSKLSLLPSLTSLFRWHFVLEEPDRSVVGEKNILKSNIKIFKVFDKIEDEVLKKVSFSYVGRFFSEFTPVFHVMSESIDDVTRYVFIDMRYYIRNGFLHHAVLEIDKDDNVVNASFNPYSINRISPIPNTDYRRDNTFFFRLVGM